MELEAGVSHSALLKTVLFYFSFTFYVFTPYVCSCMHHSSGTKERRQLARELVLAFYRVGSEDGTQVVGITANAFTCWTNSLAQRKEFSLSPNSGSVSSQLPEQLTWHWLSLTPKYKQHTLAGLSSFILLVFDRFSDHIYKHTSCTHILHVILKYLKNKITEKDT